MKSLACRFEASRCHILAARMPGHWDLPVHPSTDSVSSWASVKHALVFTGKDPWTKPDGVQESKAPAEIINETRAACFVSGPCLSWEEHSFPQTCPSSHGADSSNLWGRRCTTGITECPTALYFRSYPLLLEFLQKKNGSLFYINSSLAFFLLSYLAGGQLFQKCFSHPSWPALNTRSRTRTIQC